MQNVERDLLGFHFAHARLRPINADLFPGARTVSGFDRFAVYCDVPKLDEALDSAARHRGITPAQIGIETLVRQRFLNREALAASAHQPFWGAVLDSLIHEATKSRPTPVQMALSATLNAGNPASSP